MAAAVLMVLFCFVFSSNEVYASSGPGLSKKSVTMTAGEKYRLRMRNLPQNATVTHGRHQMKGGQTYPRRALSGQKKRGLSESAQRGSKAAADLVAMLPLELRLIERNEFAKGMTLPKPLSSGEDTTRDYEIGDFGYWNDGPDLVIFYDDIYEKTIVRVIPLGHAGSGAEALAHEKGKVRLELVK